MLSGLSDTAILRLIIGAAFIVIFTTIIVSYKLKNKHQKKRITQRSDSLSSKVLDTDAAQLASHEAIEYKQQPSLLEPDSLITSNVGKRRSDGYEKLVMLYLAARSGKTFSGAEIVLAAEKVGLVYGHHNVFHRLADSSKTSEPIFSMANVIQPGYFDLAQIDTLQTPGVSFFMTLPGPVSAVHAWDCMLPVAERMANLLDAELLDSERNTLGRQRILHIKEELRTFDREQDRLNIKTNRQ